MSAPARFQDAYGVPVTSGRELARGRHADFFLRSDPGQPPQALKVYLTPPTPVQAQKVEAMVKEPPSPYLSRVLWPTAALYGTKRQLAGLLFPLPPEGVGYTSTLRALIRPESRRQHFPEADWAFQFKVAQQLAQAFAGLHAAGYLMGDVRPEHVLVTATGEVWLVGSDDYQLQLGERTFTPLDSSAEYTPAEAQRPATDSTVPRLHQPAEELFGLAVLLFELLLGRHPYSGVHMRRSAPGPVEAIAAGQFVDFVRSNIGVQPAPGSLPFSALPTPLQALFQQAFAADPALRPAAQTWAAALWDALPQLQACDRNPRHQRVPGHPCPECVVESEIPAELRESGENIQERVQQLWAKTVRVTSPPPSPAIAPVIEAPALPSLPLGLPSRPRGMGHAQQEKVAAWTLRLLTLALLMLVVWLVQRSFLALLVVPGLILFALTLGRSFMVDWDGLIDRYETWEKGLVGQLLPTKGQHQVYRQAVLARRDEVRATLEALLERREELRERYHHENAGASFLRRHMELEQQRTRLLELSAGGGLQALHQRWHERAEREFLQLQNLRSGGVPGVGPRELSLTVAQGIRTASEVESDRVKALPAPLARELLAWRQRLQDFFQFDPSQIPRGEINQLRRNGQQQLQAELQDFEEGVRSFGTMRWDRQEAEISRELGVLQREIEQHRRALKKLKKIEV